jgi:hypothetical protein
MASVAVSPSTTAVAVPHIEARELAPWLAFAVVLGTTVLYFLGSEQGATSVFGGTAVHEFVHDARHLLGYPCH